MIFKFIIQPLIVQDKLSRFINSELQIQKKEAIFMDKHQDNNKLNYLESDVNLTTLQSQDATVTRTLNNQYAQYLPNNDQVCITDRSNSNIFNLSSHDSQSFIHSPPKKQNFGNSQQLIKKNLEAGKYEQSNIFFNCLSSQSINHAQTMQQPAYKSQSHNKYEQFALKISKLFNVRFDNLQNLYNQIKQQISCKRKEQNISQQATTFHQSDIMKRLFTYAMKIKSGHKQLQQIIQVIDNKKPNLHYQQQPENYVNKHFNQIQKNYSVKVEKSQGKTKRLNNQKTNNQWENNQNQDSQKYFSQNYLEQQNLDSLQTINTIANTKNYNIDYISQKNGRTNQKQDKQKRKSSKKSKFSEKLHLIAQQLQIIKNEIENQDQDLENKNKQTIGSEIYLNNRSVQSLSHSAKESTISNSIFNLNPSKTFVQFENLNNNNNSKFHSYQRQQNNKESEKFIEQLQQRKYQHIGQKIQGSSDIKIVSKAQMKKTQVLSKYLQSNDQYNINRQQKSYTYINSLEELPEQNDEVTQKIHQAVIKSIRTPKRQSNNGQAFQKTLQKMDQRENQKLAGHLKTNETNSEKEGDYQFKKFLKKKQPFTFSKETRKHNIHQRSPNSKYIQKDQDMNYKVKVNDKKHNLIYLSEEDLPKQQLQNVSFQREIQFNNNNIILFKDKSSKSNSSINVNFVKRQKSIKNIHPQNIQLNRVNRSSLAYCQNTNTQQKLRGSHQKNRFSPKNFSGQRLSSIYSVQTIPSVAYIESHKKLQRNSIIVQKNAKNIFPGLIQSSNHIKIMPKSAQKNNFMGPKPAYGRTFIQTKNSFSPKLILQPNIMQNNKKEVKALYQDQLNNNSLRTNNNVFAQKNQGRFKLAPGKFFQRAHFSLPFRKNDKSFRQSPIKEMRIAQQPVYTHNPNALVTSKISNQNNSIMITDQKIKHQKKNSVFQNLQLKEPQRSNLFFSKREVEQNISTREENFKEQTKQQFLYQNNKSSILETPYKNRSASNLFENSRVIPDEKMIQSLNISHRPFTKIQNSSSNIIPQNLKPPKYIPPKNNSEKQIKNNSQDQAKKQHKIERPIKTYTQGHLIEMQRNQNVQIGFQRQKDNINQSKASQNRMLQSQIEYRQDLLQKSTPSFGLQSTYQVFSKSQFPKLHQLNSSRSKSSKKKGISLSKKKEKMYTSNYS